MTQPFIPGIDGPTADERRLVEKRRVQRMLDQVSTDLSHRFMLEEALRAKIDQRDIEIIKLNADRADMKAAMDRRTWPEDRVELLQRTIKEQAHRDARIEELEATEDTLCMEHNNRAANVCRLASAALSHLNNDEPGGLMYRLDAARDLLKPLATGVHDTQPWRWFGLDKEVNILNNDDYDHSMGDDPYNEWNTWPPYMMEILNPKEKEDGEE